jgi:hypothetical protein
MGGEICAVSNGGRWCVAALFALNTAIGPSQSSLLGLRSLRDHARN